MICQIIMRNDCHCVSARSPLIPKRGDNPPNLVLNSWTVLVLGLHPRESWCVEGVYSTPLYMEYCLQFIVIMFKQDHRSTKLPLNYDWINYNNACAFMQSVTVSVVPCDVYVLRWYLFLTCIVFGNSLTTKSKMSVYRVSLSISPT